MDALFLGDGADRLEIPDEATRFLRAAASAMFTRGRCCKFRWRLSVRWFTRVSQQEHKTALLRAIETGGNGETSQCN
jgi:hypothetical protein